MENEIAKAIESVPNEYAKTIVAATAGFVASLLAKKGYDAVQALIRARAAV